MFTTGITLTACEYQFTISLHDYALCCVSASVSASLGASAFIAVITGGAPTPGEDIKQDESNNNNNSTSNTSTNGNISNISNNSNNHPSHDTNNSNACNHSSTNTRGGAAKACPGKPPRFPN